MVLHGLHRHVQLGGHLFVGQSGGDQPSDGQLGAAQAQEGGGAVGRSGDLESGQLGGASLSWRRSGLRPACDDASNQRTVDLSSMERSGCFG